MKKIILSDLEKFASCDPSQHAFPVVYPNGIELTPENVREAFYKHSFFIHWAVGAGLLADRDSLLEELQRVALEEASQQVEWEEYRDFSVIIARPNILNNRGLRVIQWYRRTVFLSRKVIWLVGEDRISEAATETERAAKASYWCLVAAGKKEEDVRDQQVEWICSQIKDGD